MRKIIISLLLVGSSMLFAKSSVEMSIEGMTCGGCASGINETFEEDYPKYNAHVDYETAILKISTKDGSDIDIKEVKSALDEMGFKGRL